MRLTHSAVFLFVVALAASVYAEDIVYVVKDTSRLNNDFLSAISDLGLTVRIVDDNNIKLLNLSSYKMMLIGNDRFSFPQDIPVNNFPSLIVNEYHMEDWYWSSGISFTSSSQPLDARNVYNNTITKNLPDVVQVYDSCCYNSISIPLYYLPKEKRSVKIRPITSTMSDILNTVVATASKGTLLKSGYISNAKGVFFGITESYMWTQDAESLFKNSILWLTNQPPILKSIIPSKSFDEDSVLLNAYDLSSYFGDEEKDVLTYSISGNVHVKANITNGLVTLYADKDWFGAEQVRFVASEEDQSTESNLVTIIVNSVNDPPVLSPLPDWVVVETDFVDVNATATDADNDTVGITYSLPLNSNGDWQTKLGDAGIYAVTVAADDFRTGIDTKTFKVTVLPKIYINEFSLEGWVELYNPQNYDLDLASWALSSSSKQVTLNSVLKSKEFLVVNLALSPNDQVLLKKDSNVVDSVAFGIFNDGNTADNSPTPPTPKSAGRKSDGYDLGTDKNDFMIFDFHTKGLSNLADVTPPVVTLVNPVDGFVLTSLLRQLSASFSVSDNKATDLSCELFMDTSGKFESLASMNVRSGNSGTFAVSNIQDGNYLWNVRCFDSRNYGFASTNRTLVVNVNDPPVINSFSPENLTLEVYENSSIGFTQTSSDPESQSLSYLWEVNGVEKSTAQNFVYSPGFFDAGNPIVKFIVTDSGTPKLSATKEWNVIVLNVNRKPYSTKDIPVQNFEEDKMLSLHLGDYFADDDRESLSYKVVSEDITKVHCSIGLSSLYMEPARDYNGNAECNIVANDGIDDSGNVTVSMVVAPVNDAPRMRYDIPDQSWDEDTQKIDAINLSDYFYDVDSDGLTYTVAGNSNITVTINNNLVSFSQPADWYGTEYVKFTASDGLWSEQSNSIRLNVKNVNDAPQALPLPGQTLDEDTTLSLDISSYFMDKENNSLTYRILEEDASKVDCTISGHLLTIKPALNYNGNAACSIVANDAIEDSQQNILEIVVNPVNDAPILKSSIPSKTWDEDTSLNNTFDLDDYFHDVDNETLVYTFSGNLNINIIVDVDNKVSFSQPADWFGSETVVFTALDSSSSVNSNALLLTVVDVNEPPVMDPIPDQSMDEDSGTHETQLNASDIDGTIAKYSVEIEDKNKVGCEISSDVLKMTPAKDFFGEASCTVKVTDNSGSTDSKVVLIHVANVNDAPVIDSSAPFSDPLIAEDGSQQFSISYHDIDTSSITVSWYIDDVLVSSEPSFNYTASGKGTFEIKAVVSDSEFNISHTWSLTATDCPVTKMFTGSTTKFCDLTQEQLAALDCVTLEKPGYGKIDFCGSKIDLTNIVYLDKYIDISRGFVAFDTNTLSPFANKPATITLYNINSEDVPKIYYSQSFVLDPKVVNSICPASVCSSINFADGKLEFKVSHFSAFKVVPSSAAVIQPSDQTCNGLAGYQCSSTDTCSTHWLSASDTSYCCSVACSSNQSDQGSGSKDSVNETLNNLERCKAGVFGSLDVEIKEPDKGDDFGPGDKISVEVKVKNNAEKDLDVKVRAVLFDKDKEDEVDSESDDFDINDDDSETMTIELKVPEGVKENHNFIIYVKAFEDGDEGVNCNDDMVSIDIKREKHDVVIDSPRITPSALSCDNSLTLSFSADNVGKDDESLYFVVQQPSLDIDFKSGTFDLDESDEIFKSATFIIPSNTSRGLYPFELALYFADGDVADSATLELNILDCISNGITSEGIPTRAGVPVVEGFARIDLLKSSFEVEPGASFTVPARVTNTGSKKSTFDFGVSGIGSYAVLLDAEKLTLKPGGSSTVYVYVKTNPDASLGSKSASVDLLVDGFVADSKAVSVEVVNPVGKMPISQQVFISSRISAGTIGLIVITALIVIFVVFAAVWSTHKPKRRRF